MVYNATLFAAEVNAVGPRKTALAGSYERFTYFNMKCASLTQGALKPA